MRAKKGQGECTARDDRKSMTRCHSYKTTRLPKVGNYNPPDLSIIFLLSHKPNMASCCLAKLLLIQIEQRQELSARAGLRIKTDP